MAIHPRTIYSKTPKGVMDAKKLDRASSKVFVTVDGKSTVADLLKKSGLEEKELHELLEKLAVCKQNQATSGSWEEAILIEHGVCYISSSPRPSRLP